MASSYSLAVQRSAEEVRRLSVQPEGLDLEFKRVASNPRMLSQLIAGFANSSGGTVLFGIDERASEKIVGVDPGPTIDAIEQALRRLNPVPAVEAYPVPVNDVTVVVLEVERSDLVSAPEGIYSRVGEQTVPASAETVTELVERAVEKEPVLAYQSLSRTLALQTQKIDRLSTQLDAQAQEIGEQSTIMGELRRGSHWSRDLFWCLLGVVLGTIGGALVTALF
jgi:predicted HTH transcriptional regulator